MDYSTCCHGAIYIHEVFITIKVLFMDLTFLNYDRAVAITYFAKIRTLPRFGLSHKCYI